MHTMQRRLSSLAVVLVLISSSLAQQGSSPSPAGSAPTQARPSQDWVKSGVLYEIFPRSFSATGDFKGVKAKLDDLKKLGVTILWIMPIHPMGQAKKKGSIGSPYAVQDYYGINPAYGTKPDFKNLVQAAHQRGLKVVIDIVANHTAWDSVLIKQHPEWFKHDASGQITYPHDWTDVAGLDYSHQGLRVYMTDMLKYWMREFDLDGFRCDVAEEVPIDFWENARTELEKIKPNMFMLAEGNKPELTARAFDADYGWPLYHALADVVENGAPATHVREVWTSERNRFPAGTLEMQIYDDHDENRGIARFGERGVLAASAFVLTTNGIPLLYNGNEAGDTAESGAPALFERLPIFWAFAERRPEFPRFYTQMIALRKAHPALQQGSLEWLSNSDEKRVVSYLRKEGAEQFLVTINLSSQPFSGTVTGVSGNAQEVTPVIDDHAKAPAQFNGSTLELGAWGFRIFRLTQ